ncbi:MAG: glycosyltransferase family 4 protein [Bacteroidetes bacterium]|nr:glycosyltransferase family 4 protein [Bacteroidota bacterium]
MKILHCVESYAPSVGGMQEVVKQLSERLVKLGHGVTVATSKHEDRNFTELNGVTIKEFAVSGSWVRGIEGEKDAYESFLLDNDFDVITFFAAQQWATDIALPILTKIKAKKVSVPTGYSGFYWPEYKEYFEKMKTWIHQYDMNVYLSNDYRDINFAKKNNVTKTIIIPNGAAADEFENCDSKYLRKKYNIPQDNFLILHVGSYTGIKGHKEALKIFLKSNIKNATLLFIGNKYQYFYRHLIKNFPLGLRFLLSKLGSKQVIINHISRKDTVAAYKEADLFLFPSNIECSPIVLFECMAAKTPFLTTNVGNSKEIIEWSNAGKLLPTTFDSEGYSHATCNESTKMLEEMYNDHTTRNQLAENGYKAWKEKFSWEIITQQYEKLYLSLISETKV